MKLKNVTIVAKPINDQYPVAMLHWIIADATRSIDTGGVVDDDADAEHRMVAVLAVEHRLVVVILGGLRAVAAITAQDMPWGGRYAPFHSSTVGPDAQLAST